MTVLEAGVGTAHAENGQQMRGIAGEYHAIMQVVGQCQCARRVHRAPVQLPLRVHYPDDAQLGIDTLAQGVSRQGLFGRFAPCQLIVDAPDIVWLAVHEHGIARVPVRVEIRQALSGQV
ncbi:hypothetical protein D3C80_1344560 [compost metagenome]